MCCFPAGPLRVKKATILQLAAKCGVSSFCGAAAGVVISSLSFFYFPWAAYFSLHSLFDLERNGYLSLIYAL